ncbi:MAG TPA: HAMP domain-containing sensor histidine kinase [Gammaproteobacteria bacterium]|nr:HAMP domain-containing sensor histidine kinase [Gammaproteobacteria bacterium]
MLHEFLTTNRVELIDRCKAKVAQRPAPTTPDAEFEHGIPVLIDQLVKTLQMEQVSKPEQRLAVSGPSAKKPEVTEISKTAMLHGRELLEQGFTVDQVVHDYGNLCQAVTELAFKNGAPIEVDEFRTLNRCLDDAIAGAVTEFSDRRDSSTIDRGTQALNERLGSLAHELRNLIHTATLAVTVIKAGNVGLQGATGAVLDRSLIGLRNLIDRSLADVRVTAGMPARRQEVSLADFVAEIKISASLEALARECKFAVSDVDKELTVDADPDMLFSAVGNLLQNAFKFTGHDTEVSLNVHATADRILIDIEDHCGGLPAGAAAEMFLPFKQNGGDRSGLGLGLSICRRSVEANNGVLSVRDVPGSGCVFTIDLPRHSPS